ncbi:MAG: hypothetical protein FWE22_05135 [Firmicutes bacterium]|nr:hypothetical protein [Bacillota bacterium]
MKNRLTVGKLIKALSEYDPATVVAVQNNAIVFPHAVTMLKDTGFIVGSFYMEKEPRVQEDFFLDGEIPDKEKSLYQKVLILCSHIDNDEAQHFSNKSFHHEDI